MGKFGILLKNNLQKRKLKALMNIGIGYFTYPFYRLFNSEKTVILYSSHEAKSYTVDNARVLFEYAENHTSYNNYFVVQNAKQYAKQYPHYHFIESGSIKNYWLYLHSKCYLFGHGPGDIAPMIHRLSFDKNKAIFLGHGVDGFKKHFKTETVLEQRDKANLFISVSDFEKNIKVTDWEIPSENVKVTGYPRFDALKIQTDNHFPKKVSKILYAPTWRNNLHDSDEKFIHSQYYQEIISLIHNKKLHHWLEENQIEVHIYLHFYFQRYFQHFKSSSSKNIKFLDPSESLQSYLVSDDILITDYSSTAWDFYYMNKPVIFYMFDREEYIQTKGSYIDLYTESIGRIVTNQNELLQQLKQTTQNYYAEVEKFKKNKHHYFKYEDQQNCKRVMELVNEKLKG